MESTYITYYGHIWRIPCSRLSIVTVGPPGSFCPFQSADETTCLADFLFAEVFALVVLAPLALIFSPTLFFFPAVVVASFILLFKASATFLHLEHGQACSLLVSAAEGTYESSYQFVLMLLIWLKGGERETTAMASSILMLAKSRVERHLDWRAKELGIEGKTTFSERTFLLLFFLPAFLITSIFRLSSLALIVAWLPEIPDPVMSLVLYISYYFFYR